MDRMREGTLVAKVRRVSRKSFRQTPKGCVNSADRVPEYKVLPDRVYTQVAAETPSTSRESIPRGSQEDFLLPDACPCSSLLLHSST